MRPLLHKRLSKDSKSDRFGDESFLSFQSSTLSPNSSYFLLDTTPQNNRLSAPPNDHFVNVVSITAFIILLLWIYCQYQLIPASSNTHRLYTKEFYAHQNLNDSVSCVEYTLFTQTLHAKCTYAYLHSSSNIGDIHLTDPDGSAAPFLQFLTLSDYGILNGHPSHPYGNVQSLVQLIDVMNTHLMDHTHFIMSSGDIFYDNDVYSAHHPRWSYTFKHFIQNKMFIAAVGNKDWVNTSDDMDTRTVNAQLQRTNWVKNWCLPKLYYTMRFVFHNRGTNTVSFAVRFIALDTSSYLNDQMNYDELKLDYLDEQYQWLYDVLEGNKKDDWIIVYGHHPFESLPRKVNRKKKSKNTAKHKYTFKELQNMKVWKKKMESILKLLLRYENVRMYISGHHHIWRVCNIDDKLVTMVTGSAGRHNHPFDAHLPMHMVAGGEEESFGKITIYQHRLRVQIIDKRNQTLFNHFYSKYKS